MPLIQNHIGHIQNKVELGELTIDQANVEMVKMARFRLVINSLPKQVRNSLNAAVKSGELGHFKKDGHKPEAYFVPEWEHLAKCARCDHEQSIKGCAAIITL